MTGLEIWGIISIFILIGLVIAIILLYRAYRGMTAVVCPATVCSPTVCPPAIVSNACPVRGEYAFVNDDAVVIHPSPDTPRNAAGNPLLSITEGWRIDGTLSSLQGIPVNRTSSVYAGYRPI